MPSFAVIGCLFQCTRNKIFKRSFRSLRKVFYIIGFILLLVHGSPYQIGHESRLLKNEKQLQLTYLLLRTRAGLVMHSGGKLRSRRSISAYEKGEARTGRHVR